MQAPCWSCTASGACPILVTSESQIPAARRGPCGRPRGEGLVRRCATSVAGRRVVTGVPDAREAADAYQVVRRIFAGASGRNIDGVTISETAPRGQELIVGSRLDPTFGPTVMLGRGGIEAEALGDSAVRLPPLDHLAVSEMIEGLRGCPAAATVAWPTWLRSGRPRDVTSVWASGADLGDGLDPRDQSGHRLPRGLRVVDALIELGRLRLRSHPRRRENRQADLVRHPPKLTPRTARSGPSGGVDDVSHHAGPPRAPRARTGKCQAILRWWSPDQAEPVDRPGTAHLIHASSLDEHCRHIARGNQFRSPQSRHRCIRSTPRGTRARTPRNPLSALASRPLRRIRRSSAPPEHCDRPERHLTAITGDHSHLSTGNLASPRFAAKLTDELGEHE